MEGTRYEMEDNGELYDKKNDFSYPMVWEHGYPSRERRLYKNFDGGYIYAEHAGNGEWNIDDQEKRYSEWYGTDVAIGGCIVETVPATVKEVYEYLIKSLPEGMIDEYFSISYPLRDGKEAFPHEYSWLAVYAVTGGSEGHYVHVDVLKGNTRELYFLAKTFQGMDHARKIAAAIGDLLDA